MSLPFLQSEIGDDPVLVEGLFAAPVERLYRAWTEPDDIMKWFGRDAASLNSVELDLREGGRVCFEFKTTEHFRSAIEGVCKTVKENQCIAFTWCHVVVSKGGDETRSPESLVTVMFEAEGAGTRVRLRHEGIHQDDTRQNVGEGWNNSFALLQEII